MTFESRLRGCFAALALALCATAPAMAVAPAKFDQVIVFGDSLSDAGNNGRWSAGTLWDEHLAGTFGLTLTPSSKGGTDYAIAGAMITQGGSSLPSQVAAYQAAHPVADPKALYAIWGGGNDVFSTLNNAAAGTATENQGVAATIAMITALHTAGARHFLIGEVPRTDLTPFVQSLGPDAAAQQAALVIRWNEKLRAALVALRLHDSKVWRYNSATGLNAIFISPTHFGFTNITTPCGASCTDPAHTLFWDNIHPGATAHAMIGAAVVGLVTQ